jgi:type IV pilus assembly protein PilP
MPYGVMTAFWVLVLIASGNIQAGTPTVQNQISPMRQDSIKMSSVPDIPRAPVSPADTPSSDSIAQVPSQLPLSENGGVGFGYDPSGRRDPFAPIIQELQPGKVDVSLPPLQRVTLTELNLIAIVWGAYGYTAMVQTPEGHGYTVRRGTRIGQNNGIVSAVTERGIIVQERFTDVYGKKQEREHVKLLHPKEGSE